MELKYTPKGISEIEEITGKPIQDVLADFSMKTIGLFVQKGLGIEEDLAYEEIGKYLADGKDTFVLYTDIMEKLQDAGFLPRQLDLKKVKKDMNQVLKKEI